MSYLPGREESSESTSAWPESFSSVSGSRRGEPGEPPEPGGNPRLVFPKEISSKVEPIKGMRGVWPPSSPPGEELMRTLGYATKKAPGVTHYLGPRLLPRPALRYAHITLGQGTQSLRGTKGTASESDDGRNRRSG